MERFTRNAGGVIVDFETGLEWLVGPDKPTTWSEARTWALKQRVDGGNWRLPTLKELATLYEVGAGKGNIFKEFAQGDVYVWSSEIRNQHTAWAFFFPLGGEEWSTRAASQNFRVFAVRSKNGGSKKEGPKKTEKAGKKKPAK